MGDDTSVGCLFIAIVLFWLTMVGVGIWAIINLVPALVHFLNNA